MHSRRLLVFWWASWFAAGSFMRSDHGFHSLPLSDRERPQKVP
jgi:hypothetical protein